MSDDKNNIENIFKPEDNILVKQLQEQNELLKKLVLGKNEEKPKNEEPKNEEPKNEEGKLNGKQLYEEATSKLKKEEDIKASINIATAQLNENNMLNELAKKLGAKTEDIAYQANRKRSADEPFEHVNKLIKEGMFEAFLNDRTDLHEFIPEGKKRFLSELKEMSLQARLEKSSQILDLIDIALQNNAMIKAQQRGASNINYGSDKRDGFAAYKKVAPSNKPQLYEEK